MGSVRALVTLVLLALVVAWSHAACPSIKGQFSDCAYSKCTQAQCARLNQECCPKPCGGTWCVEGVPNTLMMLAQYTHWCPQVQPPFPGQCEGKPNITCQDLNCHEQGAVCCTLACGEPLCVPLRA